MEFPGSPIEFDSTDKRRDNLSCVTANVIATEGCGMPGWAESPVDLGGLSRLQDCEPMPYGLMILRHA